MAENKATFSRKEEDRAYINDPPQPKLDSKLPRIRQESRTVDGVRFFAPVVPEKQRVQILGIGLSPTPEEASSMLDAGYGVEMEVRPRLLKGPIGSLIKDTINRYGCLRADRFAYTTMIPWLLPKSRRFRPKPDEIEWAAPAMHDLIRELKPECILAFGKPVFDQLNNFKIAADDARGGWFTYRDTTIPLYLVDPVVLLVTQPWSVDVLATDLREVERMVELPPHRRSQEVELDYREITTIPELEELVALWRTENHTRFSVDCEWAGNNYWDGRLRSIQFCWGAGKAACLTFFDENGNLFLGRGQTPADLTQEIVVHPNQHVGPGEDYTDYQQVGQILGQWLNQRHIRYLGHHFSADSPWMERWLGLDVLGKCEFDLEFAQQTCDEYSKHGLEVMAMKYTNWGRYDMPLVMWKRENKMGEDDGYGKVPRDILVPYSMIDTDVVWRCYEPVMADLKRQELDGYYRTFIIPFVSDVFHTFITGGLPVDLELFETTRRFFNWAYRVLMQDLREMLVDQANDIVANVTGFPLVAVQAVADIRDGGQGAKAREILENMANCRMTDADREYWPDVLDHWLEVQAFNIRSSPQMIRWLFRVLRLTPVKTTKNTNNGMPSMAWEKVMELPEKLRATLTPAVDKESIEIMSEADTTGSLLRLLAVSNVGNQCKGFLKEGEYDEDGDLVKENGLRKFICSDGRLRCNYSLTETSRPRSWKPNILNLSKYHNKGVERGIARILENNENNPLFAIPDEFAELFGPPESRVGIPIGKLIQKNMPSIRSTIKAIPGWGFTESDYKTAEIRIQAFSAGDIDLIRLMVGEDDMFGYHQGYLVRLGYRDDSGIKTENQLPDLLLTYVNKKGEQIQVTADQLDRKADGQLKHPPYDLHWSLAEMTNGKPREMMTDLERSASKVGNFCLAKHSMVLTESRGEVPIQDVLLSDRLWDGEEWVEHNGVVCKGTGVVHRLERLWATLGHQVWVERYGLQVKMAFGDALKLTNPVLVKGHDRYSAVALREQAHQKVVRTCQVYDILDAGPRNRFTCDGVLVSNSAAYGAVGTTLERRIEAATGVKPEPGTGQELLDAIARRQPVSVDFLNQQAEKPKRGEEIVAASGRKRHFPIHSRDLQGMPWRVRNSYLRAMGNEARNYVPQENVGATANRACQWLNNFFRGNGMLARTSVALYDAILTHRPDEERFVVAAAHQVFMCDINVWEYHGRWMNYPIDTDQCYRWSWKPTAVEKEQLEDPTYMAMDGERQKKLLAKLEAIKQAFFTARPDIIPRLNVI